MSLWEVRQAGKAASGGTRAPPVPHAGSCPKGHERPPRPAPPPLRIPHYLLIGPWESRNDISTAAASRAPQSYMVRSLAERMAWENEEADLLAHRGCIRLAALPGFPEVRISADRLEIREFSPADANLVGEILQCGEWLPLSTALVETPSIQRMWTGGWLKQCTSLAATEPGSIS